MSKFNINKFKKKIQQTIIYVDGGHNSMTKDEAWGCVVNENGYDLIKEDSKYLQDSVIPLVIRKEDLPVGTRNVIVSKFNDVKTQQNNGAELLAFYVGLLIMLNDINFNVTTGIIYCDSQLIVDYWGNGHVNIKTAKNMDTQKLACIKECGKLRTIFEQKGGKIIKISGDINKADLGFH